MYVYVCMRTCICTGLGISVIQMLSVIVIGTHTHIKSKLVTVERFSFHAKVPQYT